MRLCLQFSIAALIWVLGLVTLGAIVNAMDAARECSGWPLCNGQLSPASDLSGTLVFGHRFGAFILILLSTAFVGVSHLRLGASSIVSRLAAGIFVLILAQAVVGGFAVVRDLPTAVVTAHLVLALMAIAALTAAMLLIWQQLSVDEGQHLISMLTLPREFAGYLWATGIVLVLLVVSGSIIGAPENLASCSSAGECVDSVSASFSNTGGFHAVHYILAGLSLAVAAAFAIEIKRSPHVTGPARRVALLAASMLTLSILAGAVVVLAAVPDAVLATPLALISIAWTAVAALAVAGYPGWRDTAKEQTAVTGTHIKEVLRDFARVTKPGIMLLLEVTTLGAMLIAAQGWPPLDLVLLTLLGGAFASGGASALNCYYDRDIDGVMARTRKRPIPTGKLTSDQVRAFGLTLSILAVVELAWFVNPLAATMALAGNLFYVLVYTRKLKRTTPQNIVIGGAAGSFPPLVGWAAVTGSLSLGALLIAAIIFYWTPPHFWSLALLKANDYRRAGIPMLPVTHGEHETRRRILLYSFLLLAVTLLMVPAGIVGLVYGVTAAVLGGWFVIMALRMFREGTSRLAWPLFKYSNYYLAAILAAMAVDHAIGF